MGRQAMVQVQVQVPRSQYVRKEMMEIDIDTQHNSNSSSDDSLHSKLDGMPLVLDDSPVEDEDQDLLDEFQDDIVRHRNQTKTLFHQPRGDNDTVNSTRSLYDTDIVYLNIHGRRYCGDYYMPNDEDEQTRLQILHGVYLHVLKNQLTTVPLHNPEKILDIGTGTGEWAMAIADLYPECEVVGTDIAKIQPSAVPLNVFFEIDDAEEEGGWTWPEDEFNLIHFRNMAGSFCDWRGIYEESYRHLRPGGWLEVLDFDNHDAFLEYFSHDSEVVQWIRAVNDASRKSGRPRGTAHLNSKMLEELGYVDVRIEQKTIPMGVWPEDKEEQKVGKHFLIAMLCGVEALCLRPLVEVLGWDIEEVKRICSCLTDVVRGVALDGEKGRGLSFRMQVLTGRKPRDGEVVRGILQGGMIGNFGGPTFEVENYGGGGGSGLRLDRSGDIGESSDRYGGGLEVERGGFLEVEGESTIDGDSVRTMMGNGDTGKNH